MRFSCFFLLLLCFLGVAQAQEPHPEGVQITRGVEYWRGENRVLLLDLVRPAILPRQRLPLILYFHGGLWRSGDYRKIPPVGLALAREGYAFASIQFRSSVEAPFPAQLQDARAAVRFFKIRGAGYSVDGTRLGALGVSTGGQIAALLAFSGSSIAALAIQSTPTELETLHIGSRLKWNAPDSPLSVFLGTPVTQNPGLARRASPLFFADETAPPTLILHGQDDDLVPPAQSEKLFQKLKKSGARVVLVLLENQGHNLSRTRDKSDAEIAEFFRQNLR